MRAITYIRLIIVYMIYIYIFCKFLVCHGVGLIFLPSLWLYKLFSRREIYTKAYLLVVWQKMPKKSKIEKIVTEIRLKFAKMLIWMSLDACCAFGRLSIIVDRLRGAVAKGVEHILKNLKVNIWVARVRVPPVLSVRIWIRKNSTINT